MVPSSKARRAAFMATIQSGCGDTTLGQHQDQSQDFSQSLAKYTDKHTKSRQTSIDQPSRNASHPTRQLFPKKLTIRKVAHAAPQDKGTLPPASLNTSFDFDVAGPRSSHNYPPDAVSQFLHSTLTSKKNYLNKIVVVNPSSRQIGRLRKNF